MGIQGLLSRLKSELQEDHLRNYKGKVIAIDALSWLHKACYGCAYDLALGKPTTRYVDYMVRRLKMLQHFGVTPLVVFDGRRAPLKAKENEDRKLQAKLNFDKGMELHRKASGLSGFVKSQMIKSAADYFQKAVKPSQEVIAHVIQVFRSKDIQFVVAPYEADAQMVWLCKKLQASAIITEDSDLLVYSVAARVSVPLLFKLDDQGRAKMLSAHKLRKSAIHSKDQFIQNFKTILDGEPEHERMFVQFCCLSGCDFLESLPRIGIVTAQKLVLANKHLPSGERVATILETLRDKGTCIPEDYLDRFKQAEALFYHHIIFDIQATRCRTLIPPKEGFIDVVECAMPSSHAKRNSSDTSVEVAREDVVATFMGVIIEPSVADRIYRGELEAKSLKPIPTLSQLSAPGRAKVKQTTNARKWPAKKREWTKAGANPSRFGNSYAARSTSSTIDIAARADKQKAVRSKGVNDILAAFGRVPPKRTPLTHFKPSPNNEKHLAKKRRNGTWSSLDHVPSRHLSGSNSENAINLVDDSPEKNTSTRKRKHP